MQTTRRLFGFVPFLAVMGGAAAEVRLPKIFGDHAVLQAGERVPIWGWADPGENVSVQVGTESITTMAGDEGRWIVWLGQQNAGGPHELVVAGANEIRVQDVVFGEVWICSGQSNMEWPLERTDGAEQEATGAEFPSIRMFKVQHDTPDRPKDDCEGSWEPCSPQTAGKFSAVGYYFAREIHGELQVPVGMINTSWGGTPVEAWTKLSVLQDHSELWPLLHRRDHAGVRPQHQPGKLYDGMVHPLIPYRIRGALWYQGEANVSRAWQYGKLFPAMIHAWREAWRQGDFPFYFVQLAPFRYGRQDPRCCAELWEAQLRTLRHVPNTGMAVTMDIGDPKDIHPRNKRDVGKRLARWALSRKYGKEVVCSGPLHRSASIEGDRIRVSFDYAEMGLETRDGAAPSHLEIAGADRKFVPAQAKIEGDSLVVWASEVPVPVAVRYAWRDDAEPNLQNRAGLPASPFRTDAWPAVTENEQ